MQRLLEYGAYYDVPVDGAMFIRGWRLVEQIRKSIHKILWSENVWTVAVIFVKLLVFAWL